MFDDEKAVITSGNLTSGGLLRNYEYGLLIDDKSLLSEIQKDFKELSDNVNTGTIKKSDLESVRNILADIPKNQ